MYNIVLVRNREDNIDLARLQWPQVWCQGFTFRALISTVLAWQSLSELFISFWKVIPCQQVRIFWMGRWHSGGSPHLETDWEGNLLDAHLGWFCCQKPIIGNLWFQLNLWWPSNLPKCFLIWGNKAVTFNFFLFLIIRDNTWFLAICGMV